MTRLMVSNLKNTVAHNVAQQLVAGASNDDMYEYLGEIARFLFEQDIPDDYVHEIYLHAWNTAPAEVDMIIQMSERHGILIQVKSHGGSQIHPSVMLQKYFN